MSLIRKKQKSREEVCKEFGELMALVCFLIALFLMHKHKLSSSPIVFVGAYFLFSAIALPLSLSPLEKVWMLFAEKLSIVMTKVVVFLSFYILITPFGFLYRLFSKDPLGMRIDKNTDSYFIKVDKENGPGSRFFTPY